tara:strand:+ start:104 stop:310 length:207 start_codon:yes stop_codon:yes gene_type:complete
METSTIAASESSMHVSHARKEKDVAMENNHVPLVSSTNTNVTLKPCNGRDEVANLMVCKATGHLQPAA